ncbi:MAG: hypothetical protein IRY86_07085 [Thermorudis peleae]|nr:hypothetical protein [Thermorudis peleae]
MSALKAIMPSLHIFPAYRTPRVVYRWIATAVLRQTLCLPLAVRSTANAAWPVYQTTDERSVPSTLPSRMNDQCRIAQHYLASVLTRSPIRIASDADSGDTERQ